MKTSDMVTSSGRSSGDAGINQLEAGLAAGHLASPQAAPHLSPSASDFHAAAAPVAFAAPEAHAAAPQAAAPHPIAEATLLHAAEVAAVRAELARDDLALNAADSIRVNLGALSVGRAIPLPQLSLASSHGPTTDGALLAAGLAPDSLIHRLAIAAAGEGGVNLTDFAKLGAFGASASSPAALLGGGRAAEDPPAFLPGNVEQLKNGVDHAFDVLELALAQKVYAESLPLIGTQLTSLFTTLDKINTYRSAIDAGLSVFEQAGSTHSTAALLQDIKNYLPAGAQDLMNALQAGYSDNAYSLGVNFSGTNSAPMSVGLDSHLGLPGFNFSTSGTAQATGYFGLNFSANVASNGSYTFNGGGLDMGFDVTAPQVGANINLGFLQFGVTNLVDGNHPNGSEVQGHFHLGLDSALNVSAAIFGGANLGLHLTGQAHVPGTPEISANLLVNWGFDGTTNFGDVTQLGTAAPTVTFADVSYDFGSFMTDFVKPILNDLTPVFKPLQQALAVFHTDLSFLDIIPGLSHALGVADGDPITLLDFARLVIPAAQIDTIETVLDIVDEVVHWASVLQNTTFGPESYDVGSLSIVQDLRSATNFLSGLKALDINPASIGGTENLVNFIHGLSGAGWDTGGAGAGMATQDTASDTGKAIAEELVLGNLFKFPMLTDPTQAFGLLFGQTADLFQLKLPQINFGIGKIDAQGNPIKTTELFTIPILPGISVDFSAAFNVVVNLMFGYDTHGMEQFATSHNVLDLLNGFYVDDQRSGSGKTAVDIPELTLAAALEVALKAGLPGISFTGGGNLTGQLFFDLDNALSDSRGRVHLDAMGHALTTDPFGIFDVSGRISAGLEAHVDLFGHTLWQTNSGRVTLADFSVGHSTITPGGGTKPVINVPLADVSGDTLTLHVGAKASLRTGITDRTDHDETMYVGNGAGGVQVAGFNHTDVYTVGNLAHIVGAGGVGADTLSIDDDVQAAATLDGGAGNDLLYGGAGGDSLTGGADRDYIEGGAGGDYLNGGLGDDVVVGGAGADTMDGGGGTYDFVSYHTSTQAVSINLKSGVNVGGDATGDVLTNFAAVEGSDNSALKDTLTGGDGNDLFFGLRGADSLTGGAGNDILVGGQGADTLDGGDGADSASYISSTVAVVVNFSGGAGGEAQGDVLKHMEQIEGSQYDDQLTAGGSVYSLLGQYGNDTLNGGVANDILNGGLGADVLKGNGGIDEASYQNATAGVILSLVTGGSGGEAQGDSYSSIERVDGSNFNDMIVGDDLAAGNTLYGWAGADTLNGGGGGDLMLGGDGLDSLSGGAGDDTMAGGGGADKFDGGDGVDVVTYRFSLSTLTIDMGRTQSTGDAAGDSFAAVEVIEGSDLSGAGDVILGNAGNNVLKGLGGDDTLRGALGADTLQGGLGADVVKGDGGADSLSGQDGDDKIWGGTENDTIDGGIGADSIMGEDGADSLLGGDQDDSIWGGTSNDYIDAGTGADHVSGEDGADTLYGGTGEDVISGGTLGDYIVAGSEDDDVTGDAGNDTVVSGAGVDTMDGGADRDLVTYAGAHAGIVLNLGSALAYNHVGYLGSAASSDGDGNPDAVLNFEDAVGSNFGDIIFAADTGSSLIGGLGKDTLVGRGGDDTLNGGSGADTLDGGDGLKDFADFHTDAGAVVANIGTGKATDGSSASDVLSHIEGLIGSAFADSLTGSAGIDYLRGNAGNDTLDGLGGDDSMAGGEGDDTYRVNTGNGTTVAGDKVNETGASGGDRVVASLDYSIQNLANIEQLELVGAARRGTGNGSNNLMLGTIGDDTLNGLSGVDDMRGGAGSDTYVIDSQNDRATEAAGGGTDTLKIYTGLFDDNFTLKMTDAWLVNIENVTLLDNVKAFSFIGNDLDNAIVNNSASSLIDTGKGNDTVTVINGNDTVHFGEGSKDELIVNYATDDKGVGTSFGVAADGSFNGFYNNGNNRIVYFDAVELLKITTGSGADDITTGDALDTVSTGAGDDIIHSGKGADIIDAGLGRDGWQADKSDATVNITLNLQTQTYSGPGTAVGIDYIWAGFATGSGDDVIVMPTFEDHATISTNAGADTVTVVFGNDTIHFGDGKDHLIVDFSTDDRGVGTSFGVAADASFNGFYNNGNNRIVYFDAVELLTITTGSGNDDITTGDALDTITTGLGDDIVHSGKGNDIIDAGTGRDGWQADKSDATQDITLNLQTSTYSGPGTAVGIDYIWASFATGSGNDTIVMPTFEDHATIWTNAGNDTVTVVVGNDTIHFGDGKDHLIVDFSSDDKGVGTSFGVAADGSFNGFYNNGNNRIVYFDAVELLTITTGSGNDDITTGDALETITTGLGDDIVHSGKGNDIIDAGDGNDGWQADKSDSKLDITLNLQTQTYSGPGTAVGIDYIWANFATGSGNDTIVMPTFEDHATITTNAGNDTVTVVVGNDTVHFGAGRDHLIVNFASETFGVGTSFGVADDGSFNGFYNNGNNRIVYFDAVELLTITTGSGNDDITTGNALDTITTGLGDDIIHSGKGNDIIDAGAGNDGWQADKSYATQDITLNLQTSTYSGPGTAVGIDYIWASFATGSGNDTIVMPTFEDHATISTNAGNDTVTIVVGNDTVHFGAGRDHLIVNYSTDTFGVGTSFGVADDGSFNGNYNNNNNRIVYFDAVELLTITTGSGGDNIITGDALDTITTGLGNDIVHSGKGADVINAGGGNDGWQADKSDATVNIKLDLQKGTYSGPGSALGFEYIWSTFATGSGDDTIVMPKFQDDATISTNGGADTVTVVLGNDTVHFGDGVDKLIVNYASDTAGVGTSFGVAADGSFNGDYDNHSGRIVYFDAVELLNIITGSGKDDIRTGDAADTISTGLGDDIIHSGKGADIIDAGKGLNGWEADKSDATIDIVLDTQKLTYSGPGSALGIGYIYSSFATGSGNDTIVLPKFEDSVTISTNGGNDSVTVVQGNDTIHFGAGSADKLIVDYSGSGNGAGVGTNASIAADGTFNGYYADNANHVVYFDGVELLNVTTGSSNDNITTANGADTVNTGLGDDLIHSAKGADVVNGGGGVDGWEADKSDATTAITLNLQTGVYSGPGSMAGIEYISGGFSTGSGADVIVLPKLDDNAVISTNGGDDTVTVVQGNDTVHMGAGSDKLIVDFSGSANGAGIGTNATLASDGTFNGYYADNANHVIYFDGVETFAITTGASSDDLTTGSGADVISSGAGNDKINGGAGNDTLIGGAGADTLTGGVGIDRFVYTAITDSAPGASDLITGLDAKDVIDFSAIDAIAGTPANDAFTVVAAFTHHAGELVETYDKTTGITTIQLDVDGGGAADFSLDITGDYHKFAGFAL